MAQGINDVTIVGNLGRDPEVRYGQSGNAVCKLNVAVGERRKEGDQWKDHVEWVRCVLFGKNAENAAQYLQKGRQVFIKGRLQTSQYKDKDGVEKYAIEVIASQVLFLGGGEHPKGDSASRRESPEVRDVKKSSYPQEPEPLAFIDDALPF